MKGGREVKVRLTVTGIRETRALLDRAARQYAVSIRTIQAAARRMRALAASARTTVDGGP